MPAQFTQALSTVYDASSVEHRLSKFWQEQGYFTARADQEKKPFTIIMPPPNVTGELHLGHAITAALQDALTRWHRMRGFSALWLPGTDHAGIATQVMVERQLAEEGTNRHELGRTAFIDRVWQWVETYGTRIDEQHRRLGASCDWTRRRFTLDDEPSFAVRSTFVNLYNKGLIYRGERIINWCPRCMTALSDLEVNHEPENSFLYHIRYPITDSNLSITVATTRPETLFGDVAVAVNPDDTRYSHLVGSTVALPLTNRSIPIVADSGVEAGFGTGALKITPAHDPADYEIGLRHDLPLINVMNLDGSMNEAAGKFQMFDRFDVRQMVINELREIGLLGELEPYAHSVGACQRCSTIVEPMASKQWFVRATQLAPRALEVVQSGEITILPERFERVYANWMENIRDWCISRQLWWGHRIPVWYCNACGKETVEMTDPAACSSCGSLALEQDPDVLDTWFSSALWPHSTLGWPNQTEDYRYFYPTTIMETGYDILFFWVARMIMLGLENTGRIPFSTVLLHGLVRDETGRKMSKTVGNVVDPLELVDAYGADAVRLALTTGTTPGNDTRITDSKIQSSRNFANKLWNASRFVMLHVTTTPDFSFPTISQDSPLEDRWILSRLHRLAQNVNASLEKFQIGEAQMAIQDFVWDDFCDWYIEMAKIRTNQGDTTSDHILLHTLDAILRLLHPFMPFITEEIWQALHSSPDNSPQQSDSITIQAYPEPEEHFIDVDAEDSMSIITNIIRGLRNIRAEFKIPNGTLISPIIMTSANQHLFIRNDLYIQRLAKTTAVQITTQTQSNTDGGASNFIIGTDTVIVPLQNIINVTAEIARLNNELEQARNYMTTIEARLNDNKFRSKAPTQVVEREQARFTDAKARCDAIKGVLQQLSP
jgi:valyl-tRNA synthetase